MPEPSPSTLSLDRRAEIAARCASAGLTKLNAGMFEQLCATVLYVETMLARLQAMERGFDDEPADIFTFPAAAASALWR